MDFWNPTHLERQSAVVDARSGRNWTFGELCADSDRIAAVLPSLGRKSLGLLLAQNRYECLAAYLATLKSDCALILVEATLTPQLLNRLIAAYQPDWICTSGIQRQFTAYRKIADEEITIFQREQHQDLAIHPDLCVLQTTSGSTGSPKMVRLTRRNLQANATSIVKYLGLDAQERPITSLPMAYSYGLSVINSHLLAGATIVLTEDGVVRREFWEALDRYRCTSFTGVPYTYQMLLQMGFLSKKGSSLRTLTQAGGRLEERYIQQMLELAGERGWKFFVMYGQAEATARISYVPFERLGEKIGAIGVAIPDGTLTLDPQTGELVYEGPNVMLGYADCREDLAKGDELRGVLRTGDLGRRDTDGFCYITGRLKRFLKLFGKRFNLDDIERILCGRFDVALACFGRDDLLTVAIESLAIAPGAVVNVLSETLDLPSSAINVISVTRLPRTVNGKIDYYSLGETRALATKTALGQAG